MPPASFARARRHTHRRPLRHSLRAGLFAALGLLATLGVVTAVDSPAAPRTTFTRGADVSWPQCHGSTASGMPGSTPSYLILGITYGSGDTVNPCLSDQVAWARNRQVPVGAYLVPSFPTMTQLQAATTGPYGDCRVAKQPHRCRLHNAGAEQATSAIAVMRGYGIPSPMLWLDVEFRSVEPWHSHDHPDNRAVLEGVVHGMRSSHVPFGVYSTSYMWHAIAGDYRLNVPQWLPSGGGSAGSARAMCTQTATGGRTWLVQYTERIDDDLTCPILDPVAGRHSKLWQWRNRTVKLFDSGKVVKIAQHRIGATTSGHYSAITMLAARQYEQAHGLPVTGRVEKPEWRYWGAFKSVGGHPFLLRKIVGQLH